MGTPDGASGSGITVRPARTGDVPAIRDLVDLYTPDRRLLGKATVTLYEDVQEFLVAVRARGPGGDSGDGSAEEVVGCGALHVLWADLAEVRTLAVAPEVSRQGVGHRLLAGLVDRAARLGVSRVFCLTFETEFFGRHGFEPVSEVLVDAGVQQELLQSPDEGVAEFLDLARVRPNTLGNTRMLLRLDDDSGDGTAPRQGSTPGSESSATKPPSRGPSSVTQTSQ